MATTRFNPPLSLNDLPNEILSNVFQHYFVDKLLVFYHHDKDGNCENRRLGLHRWSVLSVQLLNKKLCGISREAMLKHSTVFVESRRDVTCMLVHCRTLSAIRSVILAASIRSWATTFPQIDDFFRALIGVTWVTLYLENGGRGFYGLTEEAVRSAIDGDTQWTREILVNFLNENDHFGNPGSEPKIIPWVRDVLDGNAFTSFTKPPHVQLTLSRHDWGESHRKAQDLLVFCPRTHMLSGFLKGQKIHIKQTVVQSSDSRQRGSRGHLCDASDVNHDVQQTIESILGKRLSCIDTENLSESEFCYDRVYASRNTKLEAAINEIWGFNIPACFKVIEWLEARQQPLLGVETLEQAIAMVRKLKEEDLDTFESAAVAREWQTKAPSYSPRSLLEWYLFVRPALDPEEIGDQTVFRHCYHQLYKNGDY